MGKTKVGIIIVLALALSACSNSGGKPAGETYERSSEIVSETEADTTSESVGATENETDEEIQGVVLFGGQTYTESGQPTALSDDVSTYQIQINDCVMEFPMEYSALLAKGWSVNTLYGNDTSPLKSKDYTMVQFTRQNIQLGFIVYNPDITVRKVKDCVIAGVEVNLLDYSADDIIKLPKDITIGVTGLDETVSVMGEPDKTKVFQSDDVKVDYWEYIAGGDVLQISPEGLAKKKLTFKNGVLVDIELCCFDPTDNFEFSEGNPSIVPEYEAPEKITDELGDNIVRFGGDLYRLPAPAYSFLENGWEMTEMYEELEKGADTTIAGNDNIDVYLERNGERVIASLDNSNDEAILAKNAIIHKLGSQYSYNDAEGSVSEISGGISLGMEEAELEDILISENIEYEKRTTTSSREGADTVTTEFEIGNSGRSCIVCKDGVVTAISWYVE